MRFLFVDRITQLDAETAAGWLDLSGDAAAVPPWLVIEAVGQLAAWVAMTRCELRQRPVAALVGEVRLNPVPARGRLALAARIERFDGRAILYSGSARAGDVVIAELARCVGPLLPMEVFDDPEAVRARLAALRAGGPPPPGAIEAPPRLIVPGSEVGGDGRRSGRLRVPDAPRLFAEHFPRRPVFPATLLADAQNQIALPLAAAALGAPPERVWPRRVADFKVRAFSEPGQELELAAELRGEIAGGVRVGVTASADGRRVASGSFEYGVSP